MAHANRTTHASRRALGPTTASRHHGCPTPSREGSGRSTELCPWQRSVVALVLGIALLACGRPGGPPDRQGAGVGDPDPPPTAAPGARFATGSWPGASWRPYGDGSPFNQPVPPSPRLVDASAAIVAKTLSLGPIADLAVAAGTPSDYSHPYVFSVPGDPSYRVHCVTRGPRCELEGMDVRIPVTAMPAAGPDGHLAVIDQDGGWEYDFWQVRARDPQGGTLEVSGGGRTRIDGDGLGSDATAGHFGLLAGIIRLPELLAGRIDHALFMLVGCTADSSVYPAQGLARACPDTRDAPASGQHFWLDMSAREIDELGVPEWKKTILEAFATYGAFVGDTGGNEGFALQFESGATYTIAGTPDPWAAFARTQEEGVTERRGGYDFDLASNVDWSARLRVLDPCVSARTCR